jgi:hypothetical protein
MEKDLLNLLSEKEGKSQIEYDSLPPKPPLEEYKKYATSEILPDGWKPLDLEMLPSKGFGYPNGTRIFIKAATVDEIKHFSSVDENDPISKDDRLNLVLERCLKIKFQGGDLSYLDLHQDDRFNAILRIKEMTFISPENKLMLGVNKKCQKQTEDSCVIPSSIELQSPYLRNFEIQEWIKEYYNKERGSFVFVPENGDPLVELFIPSVGVTTEIRKIIAWKTQKGKKYDEIFVNISPFIIPNWRGLTEEVYDQYEALSKKWTIAQFAIIDNVRKEIKFHVKDLFVVCSKCSAEVTAPVSFPNGLRSLFVITNLNSKLFKKYTHTENRT